VFKGLRTSSGNQTAKLKSLKGFSIFVLDEAEEENDEVSFDRINLSIREKGVNNIIVLILNPTTKEHWIYKRFFESAGVQGGFNGIKDNVCYIHTTYLDVLDHVPDYYLREIDNLKKRDIEKYNHIILGGWLEKADGVIYKNWEYGNFDDTLQYGYGQDFGFFPDPDVLVKCAIDKKNNILYLDECFCEYEQSTQQLSSKTKSFTGSKLIIADGAGKRSIEDLKVFGCNIEKTHKYPGSVEDGIRMVQNFKIVITERSKNIAKELNNYSQKNGVPIDANNHFCDAFRYYVMRHYAEKKTVRNRILN
jgi:phage terminase large subunit